MIGQLLHLPQLRKNRALENASRESIPIKTQREIGLKNNRIKHTRPVIQYEMVQHGLIGVSKGDERLSQKKYFKRYCTRNVYNNEDIEVQIQETHKTPRRTNTEQYPSRHFTVKLHQEEKYKEQRQRLQKDYLEKL